MRKIAAITIAVAALTAGAPTIDAARPAPRTVFAMSQTDCGESASLGSRVCFDENTFYGPVIVIYTGGGVQYAAFGVTYTAPGCEPFYIVDTAATQWKLHTNSQTIGNGVASRCGNTNMFTIDSSAGATNLTYVVNIPVASNSDLVEWFSNQPGYEFVWVN